MSRFNNIVHKLIDLAKSSEVNHQHAAVIIYKGEPVAYSVNRTSSGRSEHAEYVAINQLLRDHGFGSVVTKQYILWTNSYYQRVASSSMQCQKPGFEQDFKAVYSPTKASTKAIL